jgi:ubiquitin related modifier 1
VLPEWEAFKASTNNCKQSLFRVNLNWEMADTMKLRIEFGGGLELLFSNMRKHRIDIPSTVPQGDKIGQPVDIEFLIHWLKDNLLKERAELFIDNGTL